MAEELAVIALDKIFPAMGASAFPSMQSAAENDFSYR
jgi:hypothetical protein